jgi:hypothetical protein
VCDTHEVTWPIANRNDGYSYIDITAKSFGRGPLVTSSWTDEGTKVHVGDISCGDENWV